MSSSPKFRIRRGKRALDVVGASVGLVVLSPLLLATGGLVGKFIGWPVVFAQERPGLGGRPFRIYKFRTMTDARDDSGRLLPDDQRLTRFGRFLRSSSLDELPELWNVLRGDMSLVGPRPLLVEYLPLYTREQARRHDVKPGLTGLAQVRGRNALPWEQKFALDVWYVENWSLGLDLKVLGLTVYEVVTRKGITAPGRATADYFKGSLGAPKRPLGPASDD